MYKSVCFANVSNMLYLFVCHNFVSISLCMHDSIELACLFFGSLSWSHVIAAVVRKHLLFNDESVKFSFWTW